MGFCFVSFFPFPRERIGSVELLEVSIFNLCLIMWKKIGQVEVLVASLLIGVILFFFRLFFCLVLPGNVYVIDFFRLESSVVSCGFFFTE